MFSTNLERHGFPHTRSTGYELSGLTFGPSEIERDYLDGDILHDPFEDGNFQSRRKREKIRIFNLKYDVLYFYESDALWTFYDDYAEHQLYYFYINLYYFDTNFDNEWIGVNFRQKIPFRYFDAVLSGVGIQLIEKLQATRTHSLP